MFLQFTLKNSFLCWAAVAAATAAPSLAQDNVPAAPAPAPAAASKEDFTAELDVLFQAFKTRRYELLKPLLDPKAKIGSLPQGMNDQILPQIINQLPEPVSYIVTGVVKEEGATRISMTFTYANGKALSQSVVFGADRKIIALNLPASMQPQVLNTDGGTRVTPDKIEVPFELRNHLIFVSAELNGKKGPLYAR